MIVPKFIELDNYPNALVSSRLVKGDKPDYIYIPIEENSNILVHKNDKVLIGSPILKTIEKEILSTVSGIVSDIDSITTLEGTKKAIVIANDFKDKRLSVSSDKQIRKISKEKIDMLFTNYLQVDLTKKKRLVINCMDDEPCVVTENFYLFLNSDLFLEILDLLYTTYHLANVILVVKSLSSENISKLMNRLGMYPNITLNIAPDYYLLSRDSFLLSYLKLDEKETCVLSASTFFAISEFIKKNRIPTTKYITFTGDGIENPMVIETRIYSKIKEVINNLKVEENTIWIANGLMHGKIIDLNNFIIEPNLTSIFIMKQKEEPKKEKCIRCGACIDICPVGLNPTLVKKKRYQKQFEERCIKCGLCSYICPSNINFKERNEGENYE